MCVLCPESVCPIPDRFPTEPWCSIIAPCCCCTCVGRLLLPGVSRGAAAFFFCIWAVRPRYTVVACMHFHPQKKRMKLAPRVGLDALLLAEAHSSDHGQLGLGGRLWGGALCPGARCELRRSFRGPSDGWSVSLSSWAVGFLLLAARGLRQQPVQ